MKKYLPIILFVVVSCSGNHEWKKMETSIGEGLHDIEVIDNRQAFAYSYGTGNLYKTTDGGKTWDKIYQFDSIYFEQIQFLDHQHGWIVGTPNKVYKTEDGGFHWRDKSLEKDFSHVAIYGMYFESVDTGFIAAMERENRKFITNIFYTTDGGSNWELINQIPHMILNLEPINGIIYGTGHNVIAQDIQSPEGWTYRFIDSTKKIGQIRDIELNSANKIIAVSFNGYVIELDEDTVKTSRITKNRIRSLTSFNDSHWIAIGDTNKESGNLFISTDNGTTWTATKDTLPDIHRIEKSENKLWIVGKNGLVMTRN